MRVLRDPKIVFQRLINYIALESDPAGLVRNNLKILYNLDCLIVKNSNSSLSDLEAQVQQAPDGAVSARTA